MTNAEKYKDAIMAQMCKTGSWALNKSGEITPCDYTNCADCEFNIYRRRGIDQKRCVDATKEWLNAEVKKVFSEKDKEVLRALDKVQWVAREKNGTICGYHNKPLKSRGTWLYSFDYPTNLAYLSTAEFSSVKYEDDEPTSRKEILGDGK